MPQPSRDILEMEAIIRNYTIYFIFLDIVFFVVFFLCVILLIRFFKSRKKLKDSDEYLRYTIQGQEEERARIARELHDTVAQNLRYCKSLCEKETKSENIAKVYDVLSKSLTEVRAMSYNLSPPDITRNDFLFCIKNLCGEFLDSSKTQIRLSILEDTDASFLTMEEIQNLYRIVQEGLTNIVKHANAEEAVIMIRNEKGNEEKGLYIFISDDGKGFDTEKIDSRKHFGLEGMKKRADLIRANLSVLSVIDEGTQIRISKKN